MNAVSDSGLGAARKQKLKVLHRRFEEALGTLDSQLLATYPIESYVQRLDRCERRQGYHHVPAEILSQCEEMAAKSGLPALELYHKILLVSLIENYEERLPRHRIPESIISLIPLEFDRILSGMESGEEGFYLHGNDLFSKDLGLCRLKLLPCGSEVVDQWSGIPRSTLLCGGASQLIRGTVFLAGQLGGFRPLYESHWDRRLVRNFTSEQYDLSYVRIADLLHLNPEVRGMFGASWWFDRQIENIAPELSFLVKTPVDNGARIFRIGTDAGATRDATQFSKKRKALYKSGEYVPARYMLVWPRNDMLDWASRFKATRQQQVT